MNVGQEYIDGGDRFATWRDTHLRLTGQAAAEPWRSFAARWFEHKKEHEGKNLFDEASLPAAGPLRSGVRLPHRGGRAGGRRPLGSAARRTHMVAIGQAEKSV